MISSRAWLSFAGISLAFAAPLSANTPAETLREERSDRISYISYAVTVVLIAAIIAGIALVDTEESVSA